MRTADFDYDLPAASIAQSAIEPRDASRLLIAADRSEIAFRDLASILRAGDLLVVNRTRVRHCRLRGERVDTGGAVEVLLARRVDDVRWEAMLRPARRLRAGVLVGVGGRVVRLLTDPADGVASVAIEPADGVEAFLERVGDVPLPPYFTGTLGDPERYQTIFAEVTGSAAAPTAALHFTDAVVRSVHEAGVAVAAVELDVGIDTFRPMTTATVAEHRIHTESIVVPDRTVDAIAEARERGGRVVAVGTTVVRTLEATADGNGRVTAYSGPTDLFITPGYRPRVIDALITNFHAPRTTLLVMLAALMGDEWRAVYRYAVDSGFRFLSFGDAMFVEVER